MVTLIELICTVISLLYAHGQVLIGSESLGLMFIWYEFLSDVCKVEKNLTDFFVLMQVRAGS